MREQSDILMDAHDVTESQAEHNHTSQDDREHK